MVVINHWLVQLTKAESSLEGGSKRVLGAGEPAFLPTLPVGRSSKLHTLRDLFMLLHRCRCAHQDLRESSPHHYSLNREGWPSSVPGPVVLGAPVGWGWPLRWLSEAFGSGALPTSHILLSRTPGFYFLPWCCWVPLDYFKHFSLKL